MKNNENNKSWFLGLGLIIFALCVTGVYDMSGGSYEHVMGNMVDSSGNFYPSRSGTIWNEESTLDSKYYNSYSYSNISSDSYGQIAWNRARLGDATAEVTGGTYYSTAWKPGVSIFEVGFGFVYNRYSWFIRGGFCCNADVGVFYFTVSDAFLGSDSSFRSSIS